MSKATFKGPSANALTKQALRILDLKGFQVWRQNNGGVYDPAKGVFRRGSATPGISDILGFHRRTGLIVAAEIKAGRDRLSEAQEEFLAAVKAAGGLALVIRTTDDIETLSTLKIETP
ncbi:MAG TPA: VRR-NUC domain-containing protein [Flavisolibacter sp.]|nr:VRR-NUC domain-containing protein [Flavisolibacter sp.]